MEQLLKHELTIYERSRGYKYVPELRIVGKWLQELGFSPGDKISVELLDGNLVIKKIPIVIEVKPPKKTTNKK